MTRFDLTIDDIINFTVCPLKYNYSKGLNIDNSSRIGDEDLLLGAALKESFLKHMFLYQTERKVKHKEVARKFSKTWLQYKKQYSDLGLTYPDNIDKITNAYDSLHFFKTICSRKDEIALINMPYEKATRDALLHDSIDVVIIKPIKGRKATEVEIIIVDDDIQQPSRTSFISRIRATMQEIFVRRECIGHNNVTIGTKIVNLYHNKVVPVSLTVEHRTSYKNYINGIAKAIQMDLKYPNPNKHICKRCMFRTKCSWETK